MCKIFSQCFCFHLTNEKCLQSWIPQYCYTVKTMDYRKVLVYGFGVARTGPICFCYHGDISISILSLGSDITAEGTLL